MKYTYKPKNVCSTLFNLEVEGNIIKKLEIIGGCHGNTQAVCKLLEGQDIDWAIKRLKGINCHGRGTSCPDQVAQFLESIKK